MCMCARVSVDLLQWCDGLLPVCPQRTCVSNTGIPKAKIFCGTMSSKQNHLENPIPWSYQDPISAVTNLVEHWFSP